MREVDEIKTKTVSSGNGEAAKYTMATTGWMFRTVMGGLYSNKVESVIREIVSNAIDANVMAKNDTDPVRVTLPSTFKSDFSVRDYGNGMSHEFVMHLYSCVGESTKRGTNVATGMFGLGSKSPFAVCDGFTVTTFVDGTKRVYSTYYDAEDIPVIKLQQTAKTDEKNGVLVSVPVRQDDVFRFEQALRKLIFAYYDKNVEFSRHFTNDDTEPMDIVKRSANEFVPGLFQLLPSVGRNNSHNPWTSKAFVRQGTALYPLEMDKLSIAQYGSDNERAMRLLQKKDAIILFDMPIGSFDVTPSREAIQYNPKSVANITRHVATALDAAIKKIASAVGTAKSVREAYVNVINTYPAEMRTRPSAWDAAEDIVRFVARDLTGTLKTTIWQGELFGHQAPAQPSITCHLYSGRASRTYGGLPNGYASKTDRIEVSMPCVAVVIPTNVRHWEERVVKFVTESGGFNVMENDDLSFVVVRCKMADVDMAAQRLTDLDFFHGVFSDATQLPEITPDMITSAPAPKAKYGRDDVFVWERNDWSASKIKADFSVPAYFVTRLGGTTRLSLGDNAERAAFRAKACWNDIVTDPTSWGGLALRDNTGFNDLSSILLNANACKLLDPALPIYRLTEAQAKRLVDKDHALLDLFGTIRDGVVALKDTYATSHLWENFPGGSTTGFMDAYATALQRMLTGKPLSEDTKALTLQLLADDTMTVRLVGLMKQGHFPGLGKVSGAVVDNSLHSPMQRLVRELFQGVPSLKTDHTFDNLEDLFDDRFLLLNNVYNMDRVNKKHALMYIKAVMDDADTPVVDLTKFPMLEADVKALRDAVNHTQQQMAKAA